MTAIELRYYQTANGEKPFVDRLGRLTDEAARSRIQIRLARLALGNFGDCEPVGGQVMELRVDWGPGYRVYCARLGQVMVLLLCGGDKKTQQRDIERAKSYFKDYKDRATQKPGGRP